MVNMSSVISVARRFSRLAMDVGMAGVELRLMDVIPVSRENRSLIADQHLVQYNITVSAHPLDEPLPRMDVVALAFPPPN